MTSTRDDHSLSRLQLIVLARLSVPEPSSQADLIRDLLELSLSSEAPAPARETLRSALVVLRDRGLARDQSRSRGTPLWTLTDDGGRVLRTEFGLARTPEWKAVRDAHLPASALKLAPGSKQAAEALRDGETITAAMLRAKFGLGEAATRTEVCDAMIAEELGLPPGPLTLACIRAHVFARRAAIEPKGTPEELTKRVALADVRAKDIKKSSLTKALRRRWLQEGGDPAAVHPTPPERPMPPEQPKPPAQPVAAEALLAVVRETIPRVGADGRFGTEKVFVSAIWHRIERDRRLADLSLDRFKRWLVTANRDGWLVLARADLVGAMDSKLVSESEIEDRGDTFHFVLDQQNGAQRSERGFHVR